MDVVKLIVGCPTRDRTWILEKWRDHVERAVPGNWDLSYAFVVSEDDKVTTDLLSDWTRTKVLPVKEPEMPPERDWGSDRIMHMVYLRNTLLNYVRYRKPDLFLSLDSDILIAQDGIRQLHQTIEQFEYDAVGGLTWMDPVDKDCTSAGMWRPNTKLFFSRVPRGQIRKVDIIMAIKLMSPSAYNIDYEYHVNGEDLGWSKAAVAAGLTLGFDGRTGSKHLMSPTWLDLTDKRIGW